MKIDFYAPKNYYGFHLVAFLGYMCLWVFIWLLPGDGNVFAFIGMPIFFFFLILPIPLYAFEWLLNSKVKNQFFLKNKVYDIFFDIGCLLYFIPIYGLAFRCDKERLPAILILLTIFITIRILKFLQDRREKKTL